MGHSSDTVESTLAELAAEVAKLQKELALLRRQVRMLSNIVESGSCC